MTKKYNIGKNQRRLHDWSIDECFWQRNKDWVQSALEFVE